MILEKVDMYEVIIDPAANLPEWKGLFREKPTVEDVEKAIYLDIECLENADDYGELEADFSASYRTLIELIKFIKTPICRQEIHIAEVFIGEIFLVTVTVFGLEKESAMPKVAINGEF